MKADQRTKDGLLNDRKNRNCPRKRLTRFEFELLENVLASRYVKEQLSKLISIVNKAPSSPHLAFFAGCNWPGR